MVPGELKSELWIEGHIKGGHRIQYIYIYMYIYIHI